MDYYDYMQIRSNVACFSALIADSDVEEFPYLPKKRNLEAIPFILIPEYGQSSATLKLKIISLFFSLIIFCLESVIWIWCVLNKCSEIEKGCLTFSILRLKIIS